MYYIMTLLTEYLIYVEDFHSKLKFCGHCDIREMPKKKIAELIPIVTGQQNRYKKDGRTGSSHVEENLIVFNAVVLKCHTFFKIKSSR